MTALHTTHFFHETALVGFHFNPVRYVNAHADAACKGTLSLLKNMALFLASPFIGLLYALLLPVVALGMLLWIATEGLRSGRSRAAGVVEAPAVAAEPVAAATPEPVTVAVEATRRGGVAAAAMLALQLIAAPFAALAFVVVLPVAALAALGFTAARAVIHAA